MPGSLEEVQRALLKLAYWAWATSAAELGGLGSIHYSGAADTVDIVERPVDEEEANSEPEMEQIGECLVCKPGYRFEREIVGIGDIRPMNRLECKVLVIPEKTSRVGQIL